MNFEKALSAFILCLTYFALVLVSYGMVVFVNHCLLNRPGFWNLMLIIAFVEYFVFVYLATKMDKESWKVLRS